MRYVDFNSRKMSFRLFLATHNVGDVCDWIDDEMA